MAEDPHPTPPSANHSIIPMDRAREIASLCLSNPESVYDQLVRAEKWVKELKEKARQALIARMPLNATVLDIETENYTVHANKNQAKLDPEAIHKLCTQLQLDPMYVLYRLPVEYGPLPTARNTLKLFLEANTITKDQYDSCFEKSNYTVTIQPKSARTLANNDELP